MNKIMMLETAFVRFGKIPMINFLLGEVTQRVNYSMKVNQVLHVLESYPGPKGAGEGDTLKKYAERELDRLRSSVSGKLHLHNNYKFKYTFI
jgi:hypothetical protein